LFHPGAEFRDHIFEVIGNRFQLGVFQFELLQSVGEVSDSRATIATAGLGRRRQRLMDLLPGVRDLFDEGRFGPSHTRRCKSRCVSADQSLGQLAVIIALGVHEFVLVKPDVLVGKMNRHCSSLVNKNVLNRLD